MSARAVGVDPRATGPAPENSPTVAAHHDIIYRSEMEVPSALLGPRTNHLSTRRTVCTVLVAGIAVMLTACGGSAPSTAPAAAPTRSTSNAPTAAASPRANASP